MSTILLLYVNGKPVARCDKSCYDAKGEHCNCICDGRNHGAGRHLAHVHAQQDLTAIADELHGRYPGPSLNILYHVGWHSHQKTGT